MDACTGCGNPLTPRDAATYGTRCEECWAASLAYRGTHGFAWSAADGYPNLRPTRDMIRPHPERVKMGRPFGT